MSKKNIFIAVAATVLFTFMIEKPTAAAGALALTHGEENASVVELQEHLIQADYLHTNATGYYGDATQQAVREFQQDFNLAADGIAGPNTQNKLDEVKQIARVVNGEARGELYEGQVAVAAVLKNRLNAPEFPNDVHNVIHQTNAFTAVQDGQFDMEPGPTAYQAVADAWNGWDPTAGATYYYNPEEATSEWIFTRDVRLTIGQHHFAD
ncbi:N-acetylmuramoyl-L-alanine amidase [Salsuginibacillus halophilus]|uniref:N-acetylmuramoyl-L-alanine amidase n=1 Tax=Salsuginibacillus halophilus TaxID=517424 RepID=A0A2P8H8S1_9BACI|nr:cell wall hydrolase [Salsuginibacillus halophilus]PSL42591.1 N-acetylmuramoyl-L-alanine amidase [Salsuginibacillus halophilus]